MDNPSFTYVSSTCHSAVFTAQLLGSRVVATLVRNVEGTTAMLRRFLVALLAVTAVACGSDPESEPGGGRFGNGDSPTRTDDVTEGTAKPNDPALTGDGGIVETTDTPPDDTPTTPSAPTTTCNKPHDLGSIAGDDDGSTVTAQGDCTEWVRIRALETKTGPLANPMKLTATLISPPGVDFNLYAYVDTDTDTLECTTVTEKSEAPASRSDVVHLQWGESWVANDSDDSRTVSLQIVAKDPASCGKGTWALLLEGNK
jgi:hypothetical protein